MLTSVFVERTSNQVIIKGDGSLTQHTIVATHTQTGKTWVELSDGNVYVPADLIFLDHFAIRIGA